MRKREDIITIYVPKHFRSWWKRFGQVCFTEGISKSERVRMLIQQDVEEHEPGNPQPPITNFTGKTKHADPYGCGNLISVGNVMVRCERAGKISKSYCRTLCVLNTKRKEK